MSDQQIERENKYRVSPTFRVPDLRSLLPAGGRVEHATVSLESVYYDSAGHDLLNRGMTLRSRAGETDAGWQLKIPNGGDRLEVRLPPTDSRTDIPEELLALTAGVRRGAELRHIATIRTHRSIQRLVDANDGVLVELADDEVHSSAPTPEGALLQQWREIEAEFGPTATEKVVAAVDKRLVKVGATRSADPNKVAHALSDGAPTPKPTGAAPRSAGGVVLRYLAEQDDALIAGDLTLRRGLGGIHPTRVATRRFRSTLRIFGKLFDPAQVAVFDAELSWYAGVLGEVRDREVQRERMRKLLAAVPDELILGPVGATIEQQLLSEQLQRQRELDEVMNSDRYFRLLQQSRRWATQPPFTTAADAKPDKVRTFVTKGARKLEKHLAAGLRPGGSDEELHKARKAGKRARYAAELATPVLGKKKSKKLVGRYEQLQDTLGDFQDGVVAAALLRRLGAAAANQPGQNGFTYGLLYARELDLAQHSRQQAAAQHKRLRH